MATFGFGFGNLVIANFDFGSALVNLPSVNLYPKPPLSTYTIALNHHLSSVITSLNSSTPKQPLSTHTIALNNPLSNIIIYLNSSTPKSPLPTHTIALNHHLSIMITYLNSSTPKPPLSTAESLTTRPRHGPQVTDSWPGAAKQT